MIKEIEEYSIYFKNGKEIYTEEEQEMLEQRELYESEIENIYLKKFVYNEDNGEYEETYVEVVK